MNKIQSAPAGAKAWQLTIDEYLQMPAATQVEKDSVFALSLDRETPESLHRFQIKELKALGLLLGSRRSGKKAAIITSIFDRYQAHKALVDETAESLQSRKAVELNALLKSSGLPASYGNKGEKARLLIHWHDQMFKQAPLRLARAKHKLAVSYAIGQRKYPRAIAEGMMSLERATEIIRSANLEVPADLQTAGDVHATDIRQKGGRATRALEAGEIQAMFAKISGRYAARTRAMLIIGIHMALRASELCGLTVSDVFDGQKVRRYITIRSEIAKGSRERQLRIGDDVNRVIQKFLKWKAERGESIAPDAPLFVSQKGGHLSRKQLFATVKELLGRAEIDQSPHCLRKTGATIYYEQSGYDLIATQVFLGHADPSVTRRYIGITPQQTAEYAKRSSRALVDAVETGSSETPAIRAESSSLADRDHQRIITELERRGRTIETLTAQLDRLTRMLEGEDAEISVENLARGGGKVISIDAVRRARHKRR